MKNEHPLIKHWRRLANAHDRAAANVSHDREVVASLRAHAHRRGVALRLPGLVPRDQIPEWLAAADLYVQPSRVLPSGRTEGLPMATLEALAVGLPVIVSRSGGLAELDGGGGRVSFFAPNDVASLRASLLESGIDGR